MRRHFRYILLLGAILLFHFPVSLQAQYCKPSFTGCDSIASFKLGTSYSYAPICQGGVDTAQFGKTTVKVYRGKTYELRLKMSKSGAYHYIATLDWNGDGDFKDDGEVVAVDNLGVDTLVTNINIPLDATLRKTRFRIVAVLTAMTDGGNGYCDAYTYSGHALDIPLEIAAHPDDVSLITFVEPFQNGCASSATALKAVVRNTGSNQLTKVPIVVKFNGNTYTDTLKKTLKPDQIDTFTLSSTVNTSATGKFSMSAYTALSGDDDNENDSFNAELTLYKTPSITAPANQTRCGLGNFTFTATSSTTGTKTYWYNKAKSDSIIYVGNSFSTPAVNKTTTWYYESTYTLKKSLKTRYLPVRVNVGHMFDVKAKSSFIIDSFDIHMEAVAGTPGTKDSVEVYYKKGTYVGSEGNASAWIYVGTAPVSDAGKYNATRVKGFGSIPMEAGNTYAVYLHLQSGNRWLWYDLAKTYSNTDMDIITGASLGGKFSSVAASRSWDGEIYYHFKACATTRGSVTGSVNESPLGAKIKDIMPFQGLANDGSFSSPDLVCPGDTITYEMTPPPPYSFSDLGTKWQITGYSFTTVNGAYPNPKDTFTTKGTATKNATFRYVPSKTYGDSTMMLKIDLKMVNGGCAGSLVRYISVGSRPTANFNFTKVCVGNVTSFTDSSIVPSGAIGYIYDFGDGTPVARTRNTTHKYTKPGKYTVKQTLTTSRGCGDVISKVVEVYDYPKPKFGANVVCEGNPTQFTDSTANTAEIGEWLWKFDSKDRSRVSTQQNPMYTYDAAGKYTVTMVVTSIGGCKDSTVRVIEVMPRPKVDFAVTGACIGQPLTFTNTTTIPSGTVTYKWRFEDGFTSTDPKEVKHAFADQRSYAVTLVATSSFGCIDSVTKIVASYEYPTADFTATSVCQGDIMSFTDASTNGKTYSWSWGDNTLGSTAKNPTHFYAAAGTYQVKLKTFNENGCADSITKTVTVAPIPVANFSFATACAGAPVQFTDKSTEANNAKLTYAWSTSNGLTSTDKDPAFTFNAAGNYNVTLKVTSEAGCTHSIQLTVPVTSPPAPKWSRTIDALNKRKLTFTPSDLTHKSYVWYFGTGDSSTATTPTYTYANYGTYNVRLVVRTADGCIAISNDSLVVSNSSIGIAERMKADDFVKVYPNPFHSKTRVAFTLAERSQVQVTVWDVQGRRVAVLEDGNRNAGKHEYVFDADKYNAGSGVYILKVLVNDNYYTTQIVNVK